MAQAAIWRFVTVPVTQLIRSGVMNMETAGDVWQLDTPDLTTSRVRSQSIDYVLLFVWRLPSSGMCRSVARYVDRRHCVPTEHRESQPDCTMSHASTMVMFIHRNDELSSCVMLDCVSEDRQTDRQTDRPYVLCLPWQHVYRCIVHCMPTVRQYTIWCPINRQRVARHVSVSQHCHFSVANKRSEVISKPVLQCRYV
jgi:hypothetical protein